MAGNRPAMMNSAGQMAKAERKSAMTGIIQLRDVPTFNIETPPSLFRSYDCQYFSMAFDVQLLLASYSGAQATGRTKSQLC